MPKLLGIFKTVSYDYTLGIAGIFFLILLFAFGGLFSPPESVSLVPKPEIPFEYAKLSLGAKAFYVYDAANHRELFSKNGDAQLPLASLTKVMTAVAALPILPESTVITINPEFLKSEGDSGLYNNERWRLRDLLDLTLLESSNDGANAIAAVAGAMGQENVPYDLEQKQFVDIMNKKASELGLTQTYFLNPTGLDESGSISGGYGSARDVANLFYYAISTHPSLFGITRYQNRKLDSLSSLEHEVKNTNTFVDKIPSLLGSKTGFTDLAGGNLVIAFGAGLNRPIVISVLGSTEQGRFEDAEKLVWATLAYFERSEL
ncbi:MAG: hypothetical protein Q7R65_02125 [bacterium]|nr:hypothetical protein [bacterium]